MSAETTTPEPQPTLLEKHNASVEARAATLTADLERYGSALLPGSAAELARRNPGIASLPPDKRAEEIARLIDSPCWAKFRNSEAAPAKLENGQPVSALRATLSRHAGELIEGAVDQLTTRWSAELAHLRPAQLAGEIVRRLAKFDNWQFLKTPPPLPAHQARLYDFMDEHFPETKGSNGSFVRERARELDPMGRPAHETVKNIAAALRHPAVASRYSLSPLQSDDPRLHGHSATSTKPPEPARQADGRFATPPTKRPRSTF
jgi:hypothetical protein